MREPAKPEARVLPFEQRKQSPPASVPAPPRSGGLRIEVTVKRPGDDVKDET